MTFLVEKKKGKIFLSKENGSGIDINDINHVTYPNGRYEYKLVSPIEYMPGVSVVRADSLGIYEISMTPTAFSKAYETMDYESMMGIKLADKAKPFTVFYHENSYGERAEFNYNNALKRKVDETTDYDYVGTVGLFLIDENGLHHYQIMSDSRETYPDEKTEEYFKQVVNMHREDNFSTIRKFVERYDAYISFKDKLNKKTKDDYQREINEAVEKRNDQIVKDIYKYINNDFILTEYSEGLKLNEIEFKDVFVGLDCGFTWIEIGDEEIKYKLHQQDACNSFSIDVQTPYFISSMAKEILGIIVRRVEDDLDYELRVIRHLD